MIYSEYMIERQLNLYRDMRFAEIMIETLKNMLEKIREEEFIMFPNTIAHIIDKLNDWNQEYKLLERQLNGFHL